MGSEPIVSRRFLKAMFFVNVLTAATVIVLLAWAVAATHNRSVAEAERTREVVRVLRMEGARERSVIIRRIQRMADKIENARITSSERLQTLIVALAEHVGIEPPAEEVGSSGEGNARGEDPKPGEGGGSRGGGASPRPSPSPSPSPSPTCVLGVCL